MPKTKFISAKPLIARLLRNTGYSIPSNYYDDFLEWIPDGLEQLEMTNTLITKSTPSLGEEGALSTLNHVINLPCGLIDILAVEDEFGNRIPSGGDITDITNQSSRVHKGATEVRPTVFNVDPNTHQTQDGTPTEKPGNSIPIYGEDVSPTGGQQQPFYYKQVGNHLQTSFSEGFVKIHYLSIMVDGEGYPMIPGNGNFKEALTWFLIARLIGTGWKHPANFSYQFALSEFERHAGRAIAEITYPSLDDKARVHRANTRLVPPYHFYEDFFAFSEQPQRLNK